jgi:hypothetical protein
LVRACRVDFVIRGNSAYVLEANPRTTPTANLVIAGEPTLPGALVAFLTNISPRPSTSGYSVGDLILLGGNQPGSGHDGKLVHVDRPNGFPGLEKYMAEREMTGRGPGVIRRSVGKLLKFPQKILS